jgi:hypothetical protein
MENNIKILDAYGKEVKEITPEEMVEMKKKKNNLVQINESTYKEQIKLQG